MQRVVVLGLRLQRSWLTRNHSASLELTSRLLKSVSTACAQNRYRLRWREAVRDPSTSFALLTSLRMTVSADRAGNSAGSSGTKPVFTQGVESEVDVATALTRARQARLPSPWTGRGIIREGKERESEKNEREWEGHLISIF